MLTLFSPAKINLFLEVLARRPDGYHELATVMQAIDLGDRLTFKENEQDVLHCSHPALSISNDNIILKAAKLFRKKSGIPLFIEVELDKKIPMEAGLGGGSSNAATTLWAMNELAGHPVEEQDLQKWAGEIGSDISFFFSQGRAFCKGRGEQVENQKMVKEKEQLWLIKPKEGLSTAKVFGRFRLSDVKREEAAHSSGGSKKKKFYNDLEKASFKALPSLKVLKWKLQEAGYSHVTMTGTGSALFCFGEKKPNLGDEVALFSSSFIERDEGEWYL